VLSAFLSASSISLQQLSWLDDTWEFESAGAEYAKMLFVRQHVIEYSMLDGVRFDRGLLKLFGNSPTLASNPSSILIFGHKKDK
jgi:hypothetical protein